MLSLEKHYLNFFFDFFHFKRKLKKKTPIYCIHVLTLLCSQIKLKQYNFNAYLIEFLICRVVPF